MGRSRGASYTEASCNRRETKEVLMRQCSVVLLVQSILGKTRVKVGTNLVASRGSRVIEHVKFVKCGHSYFFL